jgi:hypothetical protein
MRLLAQHIQQRAIHPRAEPREAVNRFPWFAGPSVAARLNVPHTTGFFSSNTISPTAVIPAGPVTLSS